MPLDPTLDNAAFVTQWAAKHLLGTNGQPNELYIRTENGTTQATANAMQSAISLGGTDQLTTQVPSDVLSAQAQANKTLQKVALFAGLLVLTVGGLGIANVMSISVIQRSAEIGIRRAVGHSRSKIAAQFLLESLFVGLLGGALGALLGVGVVYLVVVHRALGRRDRVRPDTDLDGSGTPGLRHRRLLPVDQGSATGATRNPATWLIVCPRGCGWYGFRLPHFLHRADLNSA